MRENLWFENGTDIKVIQELLGHNSLETTMIYTHVAQKKLAVVESPLDRLGRDKMPDNLP